MSSTEPAYYLPLDPYTLVSAPLFQFTTASLPSFIVTAAMHYALTKLWIIPAGKGGYLDRSSHAQQFDSLHQRRRLHRG